MIPKIKILKKNEKNAWRFYPFINNHHVGVLKISESNQLKVDNKSRTGLTWNADMWLAHLPKTACPTLHPFQMSNQIVKFNSLKLITARNILRQHIINAITMYCEYLIW